MPNPDFLTRRLGRGRGTSQSDVRETVHSLDGLVQHAPCWAWRRRQPSVLVGAGIHLHSLDAMVNDRAFRIVRCPSIHRFAFAQCNTRNTASLAFEPSFPADRIDVLEPSVSFPGRLSAAADHRGQQGLCVRPELVWVERLIARKCLPDTIPLIFGGDPTPRLRGIVRCRTMDQ